MSNSVIDVSFSVNGNTVLIGSEVLTQIVSSLPDTLSHSLIYEELAKSTSFEVRETVARKDNLTAKCALCLAEDAVDDVILNLLRSNSAKFLTQEVVDKLLARNSKIAVALINTFDKLEEVDVAGIQLLLSKHSDPEVRRALASTYETPKKLLKTLTKDKDPDVAAEASRNLAP